MQTPEWIKDFWKQEVPNRDIKSFDDVEKTLGAFFMKILDERDHNQKLQTRVDGLLLKVNALENNLTGHRQKIRTLEGKVNTLKNKVDELETNARRVRRRRVKRRRRQSSSSTTTS